MIGAVADTSVVLKWFHSEGEGEIEAAGALLRAHRSRSVDVVILDLTLYELGNILLRKLSWSASDIASQLDDAVALCGEPLHLTPAWRKDAAQLALQHQLTFYDAAFAAAARGLGVPLITADRQLLEAGLGESVSALVARLQIR